MTTVFLDTPHFFFPGKRRRARARCAYFTMPSMMLKSQPFLLKTHSSRVNALNSTRANSRRVLSRASSVVAASTSSSRLDELIALCRDDNRGVGSTRRGEIESMIDKLLLLLEEDDESKKTKNTDDSRLSARWKLLWTCLLYTSPSPRDLSTSRMPSSA